MSQQSPKKFYLTTPIYYVNARPHIGHAYTTIVADVLARRHRLLGDDTFFLTGTDEHGQKIERSAAAAGIPPQQFADEVSAQFRSLWDRMGLTYNDYIRTTEPRHFAGAQKLFNELYNRGHIYLSTYTGSYCVSDEAFVDQPVGTPCPDCGRALEEVTEENFFFKLSAFQLPLLEAIRSEKISIEPATARNEVLSFLSGNVLEVARAFESEAEPHDDGRLSNFDCIHAAFDAGRIARTERDLGDGGSEIAYYVPGALKDLSISRSSFTWGIPVPPAVQKASGTTQNHVIYVWLDALANYMTAIGYGSDSPDDQAKFAQFWPADLHLIGKEITRFHCIYWPAFLLALNPALSHPATDLSAKTATDLSSQTPTHLSSQAPTDLSSQAPTHLSSRPERSGVERPAGPSPQLSPEAHAAWAKRWLPKRITANGWLLFDNSKMSKSKGNVVRTETILEAFGTLCPPQPALPGNVASAPDGGSSGLQPTESTPAEKGALAPGLSQPTKADRDLFASDVLRYFLLREIPFGQDGSFTFEALVTRYNADLANGYGNLVSRTLSMIDKYFGGAIPDPRFEDTPESTVTPDGFDASILGKAGTALVARLSALNETDFTTALADISAFVATTDGFITATAPWKLAKDPARADRLATVLYLCAEAVRWATAALHPYCPFVTAAAWRQLGLGDIEEAAADGELKNLHWGGLKPGTLLGPLAPIFPRADKSLIETMTTMEEQNARPASPLKSAETPATPAPDPASSFDPAAPPRAIDSLVEPSGALPVGGSHAITTERVHNTHSDAQPSGIFAGHGPADASPQITIDDFAKVELRVAQILVAERIPKADKLLRLEVDLGYEKRQILSGIAEFYTPEDLVGRRIIVITNLAPRKMRGLESHGMLLAASSAEHPKPILATMAEDTPLGLRLK